MASDMTTFNKKQATRRSTVFLRIVASLLLMLCGSQSAWAACTSYAMSGLPALAPVQLSGTYTVPRDMTVGTVIATFQTTWYESNSYYLVNCTVGAPTTGYYNLISTPYGLAGAGGINVYQTNVPGIGVQVTNASGSRIYPNYPSSFTQSGTAYIRGNNTYPVKYNFIKTGNVARSTGVVSASNVPVAQYAQDALPIFTSQVSGSVTFIGAACTASVNPVDLGTHNAQEFTGIGYTTAATAFSISLDCDPGLNSISYEFDPAPSISIVNASQSVVSLDATSSATGVGVQLLDGNSNVMALQVTKAYTGGYSSSTGGAYTLPLKARYYQTATNVTPGPANSAIAFTMTYL